ncbi:alpha/beta hydrolase [Agromyces mariniharenae]|uniref:Alpha/beta hydrolase n=1 Tax=Agromyces mariniharenae TaxID=2604423 RepID=A0A5S4V1A9_9MICO|nr:alpha/beta hydrolase [Agromyces mariniharenae]TYL52712.1 alpha/beta hydrolase [Agromyces mariniharenae]
MTASARPWFDPELEPALAGLPPFFTTLEPDGIAEFRAALASPPPIADVIAGRPVEVSDHVVASADGTEVTVSVLRRTDHEGAGHPGAYLVHGGGMVAGTRWSLGAMLVDLVLEVDAVVAAVEYRLAPDAPDPAPLEDAYAGWAWFTDHADELGFDPARVIIGGPSAGGGLSAGTTLLARDRGGRMPLAQLLMWPMLDDRVATVSAQQVDGVGIWDRTSDVTGWTALLGDRRGTDDVSSYSAPARMADLSGLPPAYLEVGGAEVFRDEVVAYASGIWAAGGSAELHVWPGGFHGFQNVVPDAAVSRTAVATREAWVRRVLG